MAYRDDRGALRQKNEQLEAELDQARRALARLEQQQPTRLEAPPPLAVVRQRAAAPTLVAVAGLMGGAIGMLFWAVAPVVPLVAGALAALVAFLGARLVVVAGPHQAVVLSGVARRRLDGTPVGYRVVRDARSWRVPIVEHAETLDLRLLPLELTLTDVPFRDDRLGRLELGACVRIESELIDRAVERFVGHPEQIPELARLLIGTATRQLAAAIPSQRVLAQPLAFAAQVREASESELNGVGLGLFALELLSFRLSKVRP